MKFAIQFFVFLLLSLEFPGAGFASPSCKIIDDPKEDRSTSINSVNVPRLKTLIVFLAKHRDDIGDYARDVVSGLGTHAGGDSFLVYPAYRIGNADYLVKGKGRGWYYETHLESLSGKSKAEARAIAQNSWDKLHKLFSDLGFSDVPDNPWDTFTMKKQMDDNHTLQVWLSFDNTGNRQFIALKISPNFQLRTSK